MNQLNRHEPYRILQRCKICGSRELTDVIAIAPQAFVSVLETPRIDGSIEAIVHLDTAPAEIGNGGGVAAPTRSLYQTNSVGLRMITPVSWGLRSSSAVAWLAGVNW